MFTMYRFRIRMFFSILFIASFRYQIIKGKILSLVFYITPILCTLSILFSFFHKICNRCMFIPIFCPRSIKYLWKMTPEKINKLIR